MEELALRGGYLLHEVTFSLFICVNNFLLFSDILCCSLLCLLEGLEFGR